MQVLWATTIFEHNWLTPHPPPQKNASHLVFGTRPDPEWTGRDPWVSAEHVFCFYSYFFFFVIFYSPAASALTVKSGTLKGERHISKNAWMLLVLVELKHGLLVWNILSRLNTKNRQQTLIKHIQKERKVKHLCRFSPPFLLQRNIQSELLCTHKNMCQFFSPNTLFHHASVMWCNSAPGRGRTLTHSRSLYPNMRRAHVCARRRVTSQGVNSVRLAWHRRWPPGPPSSAPCWTLEPSEVVVGALLVLPREVWTCYREGHRAEPAAL